LASVLFSSLLFTIFHFSPLFRSSSHQLIKFVTLSQDYLNLRELRFMSVQLTGKEELHTVEDRMAKFTNTVNTSH
jgi:hypothetical protein